MKGLNIEKQLKREGENVPDVYDKILLEAQAQGLIKDGGNSAKVNERKNRDIKQRIAISGFATSLVALATCIVVLVIVLTGGGFAATPVEPVNPQTPILASANEVYAMGAATSVKLLAGSGSVQAAQALATAADGESIIDDIKSQVEKFNEYFTALDSFFGEDYVSFTKESNSDSDYPYDTKLTVKYKDINGVDYVCLMYFTETPVKEKTNGKESEKEYALSGVAVMDGVEYYIEGERIVEEEKDELENELKIRTYVNKEDKSSYIQMQREYSVESDESEVEYVYSVFENGKLVEQTSVEMETERKGNKVSGEYEFEFISGEYRCKYSIEREVKNDKVKIMVEYNINGSRGKFTIDPSEANEYLYTFEDGTTLFLR